MAARGHYYALYTKQSLQEASRELGDLQPKPV